MHIILYIYICICIGDLGAAQLDKDQIQVAQYKSTNTDAAAGTDAQILTQPAVPGEDVTARSRARNSARGIGTQFTCFTGTKVPILTAFYHREAGDAAVHR